MRGVAADLAIESRRRDASILSKGWRSTFAKATAVAKALAVKPAVAFHRRHPPSPRLWRTSGFGGQVALADKSAVKPVD